MSRLFSLTTIAPALFVIVWSTGWIGARAAAPYADALTFLALRFMLAFVVLGIFAAASGARWPRDRPQWMHGLASGVLLHAVYLGGVWWAVKQGVPAGISGLIAALQPLMTAALAFPLARERLSATQVTGIVAGLLGVGLVLWPKLAGVTQLAPGMAEPADYLLPLTVNILAMLGVTLGSFYQKRFLRTDDLRTLTAVQYLGAIPVVAAGALLLEPLRFEVNVQTVLTMAWSVLALSIGAIWLMLMMIREGAVSRVASLIYLVPPTVALQAWLFFGETLVALQFAGMAVTALGVYLATRKGGQEPQPPARLSA